MAFVDLKAVVATAQQDPEFTRETRYLSGDVKIDIAGEPTIISFADGKVTAVDSRDVPDDRCKIVVRGTGAHWQAMLEKFPKPFYQCLQSSAVKHQLHLSETNETFAYLPALNRLMVLIRNHHHKG